MNIFQKLEKTLRRFDRSAFSVPLNYPVFFQLKVFPRNIAIRIIKGLFANIFMKGYEVLTNERIVEIPFVFHNLKIPPKSKVLDFGCNDSIVSIELASLGYDVTGVDLNDYLFTHPNFRLVKEDFLRNTFRDESFDAIVAISAIEHCGLPGSYGSEEFSDGDRKAVDEFYRILKKGGKLLLTVPFGRKGLILGALGQKIYGADSLDALLDKFKIIKEEYFVGIDRKHWLPVVKEDLAEVDSVSKGFAQGVACICASKETYTLAS